MEREFGYRSDKASNNSVRFGGSGVVNTIDSRTSSMRDKVNLTYTEPANGLPARSYESTHETIGKYKSRSNNAYDDSDYSIRNNGNTKLNNNNNTTNNSFSPLNRPSYPKVDHDEYWRTNI